jgi:hypothetical protein
LYDPVIEHASYNKQQLGVFLKREGVKWILPAAHETHDNRGPDHDGYIPAGHVSIQSPLDCAPVITVVVPAVHNSDAVVPPGQ